MRSVVAYPGTMDHAQQVALAMHEYAALDAFVTTFAWNANGTAARLMKRAPALHRVERQLGRRAITALPLELVHTFPYWELLRTLGSGLFTSPVPADRLWDLMSKRFDQMVARQYAEASDVVQVFEYTGLATLRAARVAGRFTVLHLPSLDSRAFEVIQQKEKEQCPELAQPWDGYFSARFEERYARRRAEIDLADLIISNSQMTSRSHIAAGTDPTRIVAIPLAAPKPIQPQHVREHSAVRPLIVLWAGNFSPGKGALYMLDAWRRLASPHVRLHVYGRVAIPSEVLRTMPDSITLHGSVPRSTLFEAYADADVLVFPTLSDGFGMVVAEALAHGLPVITTDRAGAADLLDETCGIIVPAGDASALADALARCLDQRVWLADMRPAALAAAARRQWPDYRRDVFTAISARFAAHCAQ